MKKMREWEWKWTKRASEELLRARRSEVFISSMIYSFDCILVRFDVAKASNLAPWCFARVTTRNSCELSVIIPDDKQKTWLRFTDSASERAWSFVQSESSQNFLLAFGQDDFSNCRERQKNNIKGRDCIKCSQNILFIFKILLKKIFDKSFRTLRAFDSEIVDPCWKIRSQMSAIRIQSSALLL